MPKVGAIIGLLFVLLTACSSEPRQQYTVMETNNMSYGGTKRMQWKILLHVKQVPTEEEIKALFFLIANSEKHKWDHFFLHAYLPGMSILHASFARADFTSSGMKRFEWDKDLSWSPPEQR